MSDHEQLHEAREDQAERLERDNERLEEHVADARKARERAAEDPLIPAPAPDVEGEQPPPEADYTSKGD